MVARITSGSSPAGALFYNKEKIDKEKAYLLLCQNALMTTPSDGRLDMIRAMKTFQPYLDANLRTKKMVFHVSLNPAPEDKLSDSQLSEIAQVYMEKMGYGGQPYFVFKHTDIDRDHLHIVSLRIDSEGRKLPHDFEARRSMDTLR